MLKTVSHYPQGNAVPLSMGSSILLYNTADQTTNYERMKLYWSSNIAKIELQAAGTGSTARSLQLSTADGSGFVINANGRMAVLNAAGGQWGLTHQSDAIGLLFTGRILSGTTVPSIQLGNDTFGTPFNASSGTQKMLLVSSARNQTGTAAFTGLEVNITGTGGSGSQRLADFQEAGTSRFYVEATAPTSGNTVAFISYHNGAGVQLQRVTLGAADSGGAGFKVLRVPN